MPTPHNRIHQGLRVAYDLPPKRVIPALRALAGLSDLTVEDAPLVGHALDWAEAGLDLDDALHFAATGCESLSHLRKTPDPHRTEQNHPDTDP